MLLLDGIEQHGYGNWWAIGNIFSFTISLRLIFMMRCCCSKSNISCIGQVYESFHWFKEALTGIALIQVFCFLVRSEKFIFHVSRWTFIFSHVLGMILPIILEQNPLKVFMSCSVRKFFTGFIEVCLHCIVLWLYLDAVLSGYSLATYFELFKAHCSGCVGTVGSVVCYVRVIYF